MEREYKKGMSVLEHYQGNNHAKTYSKYDTNLRNLIGQCNYIVLWSEF